MPAEEPQDIRPNLTRLCIYYVLNNQVPYANANLPLDLKQEIERISDLNEKLLIAVKTPWSVPNLGKRKRNILTIGAASNILCTYGPISITVGSRGGIQMRDIHRNQRRRNPRS